MEGILQKFENSMFGGVWKPFFMIVHEDVLQILELPGKSKIVG